MTDDIEQPSIHALMSRVMADIRAIGKNQKNTQQNYAFRGIDDVMNELKPVLAEHGVFFVPESVVTNEHEWRQTKSGGTQHSTVLRVRYRFYGPAGDSVVAETIGESADPADKSTQQAMSQGLKSLLLQTFCIGTEESARSDPDSQSPMDGGALPTHVSLIKYVGEKLTKEQWEKLKSEWQENYDFSVYGVPFEREQEMRQLIDKFSVADVETGEVQRPEPKAEARSDGGAGAENPDRTPQQAIDDLVSIFKAQPLKLGEQPARARVKEIWESAGYADNDTINADEWAVLAKMAQNKIDELTKPKVGA
jgi:hypothetical protein